MTFRLPRWGLLLALWIPLPGCGALGEAMMQTGTPSEVLDKPDLTGALPQVQLRMGLFAEEEVRQCEERFSAEEQPKGFSFGKTKVFDATLRIGNSIVTEAEANFRLVFPLVTDLAQFPPTAKDATEIDVVVVVGRPNLTLKQVEGRIYAAGLAVPFTVCSVSGTKVEETVETASIRMSLSHSMWSNNNAGVRLGVRIAAQQAVHQFLLKAPALMKKRFD